MSQRQQRLGHNNLGYFSTFYDWKGSTSRTTQPSKALTTVAFQNLHGLPTTQPYFTDKVQELLQNMEDYKISMIGVSEHNIAMSNNRWRQQLHECLQQTRPQRIAHHFNSGPEKDNSGRLMGGIGLIAIDDITGRLIPKGRGGDEMGRWSFMHLRRNEKSPLTIITVYQVCKSPTNTIGDTSWHQQRRYLDLHNRPEHPRQAFMRDLSAMVHQLQAKNHAIIIGGDWNDWLGSPRSQLLQLCTNLNLVDPWLMRYPDDCNFATYEHGSNRIDSVFISQELIPAVESVRYSPGGWLCSTDHRAVVLSFDTAQLFGKQNFPMIPMLARGVRSNDRISVSKFVEVMHHHLLEQNAFARGKQLSPNDNRAAQLVEQLDALVGEAGNLAEQRCHRRRSHWFSSQLAATRQIVSLLRYYVNGLKANIDRSKSINTRLHKLNNAVLLPPDLPAARILLSEFEHKLNNLTRTSQDTRAREMESKMLTADPKQKKALHALKRHEHNAQTWKILTFMTGQHRDQQLDRLDIPSSWPSALDGWNPGTQLEDPKTATSWRTITDPLEIEQCLMMRNCQHFGQAHGTPFTHPPLSTSIDWGANDSKCDEILVGTYQYTEHMSTSCKTLLTQCQANSPLDTIPAMSEFEGKILQQHRHLGDISDGTKPCSHRVYMTHYQKSI